MNIYNQIPRWSSFNDNKVFKIRKGIESNKKVTWLTCVGLWASDPPCATFKAGTYEGNQAPRTPQFSVLAALHNTEL